VPGENWTARQVNAIESSPLWKSTAIVIVWDDFGGFYDHVPRRGSIASGSGRARRCW
jgi:phospholipase C